MRESSNRFDPLSCSDLRHAVVAPLLVVLVSCGGAPAALEGDRERRVPDGVAIDGVMAPPPPVEAAEAGASVVSLKAPLGDDAVFEALRQYFEAVSAESPDALRRTLSGDAMFVNPVTSVRDNAFLTWSRRFARLDYRGVSSAGVVSRENVELKRVAERDGRGESDVLATLRLSSAVPPALFGESMVARLRREGGRFLLVEIVEEFQVP